MDNHSFPSAFISYAHEDKDLALQIARRLTENGVNPWIDAWEIAAGESLVERVFEKGLKDCAVFVIVLSPASVDSNWVKQELDVAVVNRIRRLTQVIPILASECEVPVSLRALKWLDIRDGLDNVVRAIVDAAYQRRPEKPLIQPEPDRIKNLINTHRGFSVEASTIAVSIARSQQIESQSDQFYDGRSFQSELDFTPEQINDAIDELGSRGFVKVLREIGTGEYDFSLVQPTYALFYEFSDYLPTKIDPEQDIKQVAATIASHGTITGTELNQELKFSPKRVNWAVAYLSDYGVIKVLRTLGTGPYDFAEAMATSATRRFVGANS
jgi:hypothetical protein